MVITGKRGTYQPIRRFGSNDSINYHLCLDQNGKQLILAIASSISQNGKVDQYEYLLSRLEEASNRYQKLYNQKVGDGRLLHYDWLFPKVVESFMHLDRKGQRQLVVLDFPDANLEGATALLEIVRTGKRVDLRTSAWIMGRMLKLSGFLHENNIYCPMVLQEFLIIPDEHRLILLDWTQATLERILSETYSRYSIQQAAECTLRLLGATHHDGIWSYDYEIAESERPYLECLTELHRGTISEGNLAHQQFYAVVHSIWKKEFYPFTTHNQKEG